MTNRLAGKVAIVTGSGRGIGRSMSILMAKEGAKVIVVDPGVSLSGDEDQSRPADDVVAEIKSFGGIAVPCYELVGSFESAEKIVAIALENFDTVDILATCHGILRDRMIYNMSEDEWDAVIHVHLKGTFSLIRSTSKIMRKNKYGRIIAITSTSGLYGNAGQANYGAAKDGIAGLVRVAAKDLGRSDICVNAIAPSADTRMTEGITEEAKQKMKAMGLGTPDVLFGDGPLEMPRPPEAVAPLAVWLASDESAYVNGQVFYSFGGVISVMGHPKPVRIMEKQGRWEVEELIALFPTIIGFDLQNPAPTKST